MATKVKVALFSVLLVLAGVSIGVVLTPVIRDLQVPVSHKSAIEAMEVWDRVANVRLTPKLVYSGSVTWFKGLTLHFHFTKDKAYPHTTWVWMRYDDVELVMDIIGPDDDQQWLSVEVARMGWNPFEVKVNGVTQLLIEQISGVPAVGYYQFEIKAVAIPSIP